MTTDFGTYRLTYTPGPDMITPSVDMTLSGEADLSQMLSLFEAFLQASGYVLKGELEIVEPDTTFVPFSKADDVLSFGAK